MANKSGTKSQNFKNILILNFLAALFCFALSKPASAEIFLENLFSVSFNQPLDMAEFPELINGEKFFAVAEKQGRIYLASPAGGKYSSQKFLMLDMENTICSSGYEEGLLGLAFDPEFKTSKRAYIYYSRCRPRTANISRINFSYTLVDQYPVFNFIEENILSIDEPYSNHNGGCLQFGPDGYLYIGVGDGGSGGDPHNNGQNLQTLLGKILRIDVGTKSGYSIPKDNPFIKTGRPEIFAYGLRNPWRFSFDKKTGLLIAGDVGQNAWEEISIIRKGENHGWRIMEGSHCFKPFQNCQTTGLTMPVYDYGHDEGGSVIGGFFYRSARIERLNNKYIFGDYISGTIWTINDFTRKPHKAAELLKTNLNISSFARDESGEVYVISINKGKIFRFMEK